MDELGGEFLTLYALSDLYTSGLSIVFEINNQTYNCNVIVFLPTVGYGLFY